MRIEEFCLNCKHHYTFHESAYEHCRMLYPPRYVDLSEQVAKMARTDRVFYNDVNFCKCEKFV